MVSSKFCIDCLILTPTNDISLPSLYPSIHPSTHRALSMSPRAPKSFVIQKHAALPIYVAKDCPSASFFSRSFGSDQNMLLMTCWLSHLFAEVLIGTGFMQDKSNLIRFCCCCCCCLSRLISTIFNSPLSKPNQLTLLQSTFDVPFDSRFVLL